MTAEGAGEENEGDGEEGRRSGSQERRERWIERRGGKVQVGVVERGTGCGLRGEGRRVGLVEEGGRQEEKGKEEASEEAQGKGRKGERGEEGERRDDMCMDVLHTSGVEGGRSPSNQRGSRGDEIARGSMCLDVRSVGLLTECGGRR